MAGDIFGNQDIGRGQSAIQAAQPISNTSKATAIEGLQYLDPLIGKLAEGAAKQTETGNGDEVLNEFSKQLGALEASRKTTGGIKTNQELLNKQWQLAQRFKDYNPHLREDLDKITKTSQDVYGFAKADVEAVAQEDAQKRLVTDATTMGLMRHDETDPAVIQNATFQVQKIQAAQAENKALTDQLAMRKQQLEIGASEHTQSRWPVQDAKENLEFNSLAERETIKNNLKYITSKGAEAVGKDLNATLIAVGGNPSDPKVRQEANRKLDEQINNVRISLYQQPGWDELDMAEKKQLEDVVLGPVKSAQEMLRGDTDVQIIKNTVENLEKTNMYSLYMGRYGEKAVSTKNLTTILGNTPMNAVQASELSNLMVSSDALTPAGNPVPQSLFIAPKDGNQAKAYEVILSTPDKIARAAAAAEKGSKVQEHYDKQMFDLTDSIMNGMKPGPNGELDPKAMQNALKTLSSDEYNAWAVRYQPNYTDAVKQNVGTLIRTKHGEPAFYGAGNAMNTRIPGGKLASDYVQLVWQDGGIVAKSKVVNNPSDQKTVDIAIGEFNKIREGLSQIVKADATVQNSNDFQGVLDGYSKVFYGVENVSNTPVKGSTQTSVTNQMSTNAKNDLSYLTTQPEPAPTAAPSSTSTTSPATSPDDLDARAATIAESLRKDGLDDAAIQEMLKSFYESNGVKAVVIKK